MLTTTPLPTRSQRKWHSTRHQMAFQWGGDPLVWWKSNECKYPHIAMMARRYLAVPGTLVPSERVFSTAGDIVTAKRSTLSPENVDILIFLKKNLKL
ncbi:hypothetical protein VZT92_012656 [Zoarces viviparus]|uniref:HAT C-terminal dimerisation domain-containing protein n=1 Tax=Zoarces viviparus TaxID=48416 RepID=A0AAW1F1Q2_ZOAVI